MFAYTQIASAFIILCFTFLAHLQTYTLAKRYDEQTVTPCDYTLFFKLTPAQNQVFNDEVYDYESDISKGEQMRWCLINELPNFFNDDISVARMDLAFDNGRLIKHLTRRGYAIRDGNHKLVERIESAIEHEKQ